LENLRDIASDPVLVVRNYFISMTNIKLSVIVVCLNPANVREACLDALQAQVRVGDMEVLAVGHWSDGEKQLDPEGDFSSPTERFPVVKWLSVPAETTIPQMRTYAILRSYGEIVALLEDDCVVSKNWVQEIMQTQAGLEQIVGGPVAPGKYRYLLDWALYFCEYGRFMPPFYGPQNALPGNNVAYKKIALPSLSLGDGFYEVFFHDAWMRLGKQLIADPKLEVTNVNHWSLRHVTNMPFHHGRAFAGMRSCNFALWQKGLYTILSFALPVIKATRLATVVFTRKQYRTQFLLSLPWSLIFLSSWSLGELVGYAAGPGHSAEQWR